MPFRHPHPSDTIYGGKGLTPDTIGYRLTRSGLYALVAGTLWSFPQAVLTSWGQTLLTNEGKGSDPAYE
jgi:hypothetical protein